MTIEMLRDDEARARYVIGLKRLVNLDIAADLRSTFEVRIRDSVMHELNRPLHDLYPEHREAVRGALSREPLYRTWSALTYLSQSLMWDTVETFVDRQLPRLQQNAEALSGNPAKHGSLELHPELEIPSNIANVHIHRQPGGFCAEKHDRDIEAGARYEGGGKIYAAGKGRKALAGRSGGDFVRGVVAVRWPNFEPLRILEVGCGTGRNTLSYARIYPDAEVHAVDCAAPLLRWAHATAESQGLAIHFKQMDAARMSYPDKSFDLIVSHIVGHEMTREGLPAMVKECHRLLRPGGITVHVDVATQPGYLGLVDQVLNDWQVLHNNEPSWRLWSDADALEMLRAAGFAAADRFAEPIGGETNDVWFVYGGRKQKPIKK